MGRKFSIQAHQLRMESLQLKIEEGIVTSDMLIKEKNKIGSFHKALKEEEEEGRLNIKNLWL